jgi:hypothetical protein
MIFQSVASLCWIYFFCRIQELNTELMQLINNKPAGLKETREAIVEVKLWEAFLLYNRHNLYGTLCTYSLDNAPLEKDDNDLATVSFRFMDRDWNNTLKKLLNLHNIPVIQEKKVLTEKAAIWHA